MVKNTIKYLGMMCLLLMLLPVNVKASESITGGATFEEAVEVQLGKEYTTTTADGWFKMYVPENTRYIGAGYDEFTSIDAYDANKERISTRYLFSWMDSTYVELGDSTRYWDSYSSGFDLGRGKNFIYYKILSANQR